MLKMPDYKTKVLFKMECAVFQLKSQFIFYKRSKMCVCVSFAEKAVFVVKL